MVPGVERLHAVGSILQVQGEQSRSELVLLAVAVGHRGVTLHKTEAADVLQRDADMPKQACGLSLVSGIHDMVVFCGD